jgi:protease-4
MHLEGESTGLEKRLFLVLFAAIIVIILGFAYLYLDGSAPVEQSFIGIINVDGPILTVEGTQAIIGSLSRAIGNNSIKGVVIKIDSPGGFAHLVEEIYYDVLALKSKKPVVSSLVTALSGGYYIAAGTDYIIAAPSAMVGNVGVIGTAPSGFSPSERSVETGPYKITGFSRLLFPLNISSTLENFAGAVEDGRGNRLKVSGPRLRTGAIYMGSEGISAGLVDEIGALQKAVDHVASEVGVESYTIVDLLAEGETGVSITTLGEETLPWRELTISYLNELYPPPAMYYLYLPSQAYQFGNESALATEDATDGVLETKKGRVVVDLSHGNRVPSGAFHLLSAELAMREVYTAYEGTWSGVENSLASASCLIIAAPTETYTAEEFKVIDDWVRQGRLLLFFYDPTTEFNDDGDPLRPINSIANRYGLTFGQGYLYNLEEMYGLYRNIYVRSFDETNFTKDIESLILLTSTYLHSTDSDAAWTSSDTFSSSSEQQGRYAPISVLAKGNGTTAAFGDITFMMEPYVYLEDNYQVIMNIVEEITEIRVPVIEEPEEPEEPRNITEPDLPVGTVKIFDEVVDGEESEMIWSIISETEIRVERPDRTTVFTLDDEGRLVSWTSGDIEQVYDGSLPDLPYPLEEDEGWTYKVGYNVTLGNVTWRGQLESRGTVVGFEYVEAGDEILYWCAKIVIMETDELDRVDDILVVESSELLWISQDAGTVKVETNVDYYIGDLLVLEEIRSILLRSMILGQP